MVNTDWNNDLGDDILDTDLPDDDSYRDGSFEDREEKPFEYSPFSPYYNKNEITAPSMTELFNCLNPKP